MKIAAFYYPGWHRQESKSSYKSDDEWDIVRDARPYFEGHHQPRVPLMGYLDDSKVETLMRQVDLAQSHGLDAFIFDWYWKKDAKYFEKSIKAFMQIDTKMDFALMYSWKLPRKNYPIQLVEPDDDRWVDVNVNDFRNLLDYCCDNYFHKENYWKVNGKPYFVMYFAEGFMWKIGKDGLSQLIDEGNALLRSKGYDGLYTVGVVSDPPKVQNEKIDYPIKDIGFDALTGYNFLADFSKNAPLVQDYIEYTNKRVKDWDTIKDLSGLPYIPSISAGWDATPRGVRLENLTEGMIFPWSPIVANNSPETFGQALSYAKDFNEKNNAGTPNDITHICAWNEWSEGAYLEPDAKNGYGFLEQIKKIKDLSRNVS